MNSLAEWQNKVSNIESTGDGAVNKARGLVSKGSSLCMEHADLVKKIEELEEAASGSSEEGEKNQRKAEEIAKRRQGLRDDVSKVESEYGAKRSEYDQAKQEADHAVTQLEECVDDLRGEAASGDASIKGVQTVIQTSDTATSGQFALPEAQIEKLKSLADHCAQSAERIQDILPFPELGAEGEAEMQGLRGGEFMNTVLPIVATTAKVGMAVAGMALRGAAGLLRIGAGVLGGVIGAAGGAILSGFERLRPQKLPALPAFDVPGLGAGSVGRGSSRGMPKPSGGQQAASRGHGVPSRARLLDAIGASEQQSGSRVRGKGGLARSIPDGFQFTSGQSIHPSRNKKLPNYDPKPHLTGKVKGQTVHLPYGGQTTIGMYDAKSGGAHLVKDVDKLHRKNPETFKNSGWGTARTAKDFKGGNNTGGSKKLPTSKRKPAAPVSMPKRKTASATTRPMERNKRGLSIDKLVQEEYARSWERQSSPPRPRNEVSEEVRAHRMMEYQRYRKEQMMMHEATRQLCRGEQLSNQTYRDQRRYF